jgi:hypothetical protein
MSGAGRKNAGKIIVIKAKPSHLVELGNGDIAATDIARCASIRVANR